MNLLPLKSALDAVFHWVIQNALPATVLIALVVIVQIVFRRSLPPRWRYALGLLILLRLALPVAPASSLSIFNLATRAEPPPVIRPVVPVPAPLPEIALAPPDFETVTTAAAPNPVLRAPVNARLNLLFLVEFAWLAGFVVLLAAAVWRHHRFAAMLRGWGTVAEPRANALLNECRVRLRVRRNVRLLSAEGLSTPALFGHWRPALLIPGEMLRRLGDRELRHIFLHELAHLKRGDILVNWAMIFVRALHWFNPVVWFAFRRLRADQELACDADVMALLDAGERRSYGGTLIKVLEDFSASGLCPGLVPFVTRKPVIQRRITMIAQYKPAGRLVAAASFALLVALGCVTFTRAAGKQSAASVTQIPPPGIPVPVEENPSMMQTAPGAVAVTAIPSTTPGEAATDSSEQVQAMKDQVAALEQILKSVRERIAATQKALTNLQKGQGSLDELSPAKAAALAETVGRIKAEELDIDSQRLKQDALLNRLRKLKQADLIQVLPTTVPDSILNRLLEDYNSADSRLSGLKGSYGPDHPDVVAAREQVKMLNSKIEQRADGILKALETQVAALDAQAALLEKRMADMQKRTEANEYYEQYRKWVTDLQALNEQRAQLEYKLRRAREELSNVQPGSSANIPPGVRLQYYDARKELDQARSEYQRLLRTDPQSSPLLQAPQARMKAAEDLLRQLEAAYPAIQSIPNSRMSSASPADVLVVNIQSDGSLRIDGSKNSLNADELTLAIKDGHPSAIEIRADSSAPFTTVVKVMDAARNGGVPTVSIHTTPSKR